MSRWLALSLLLAYSAQAQAYLDPSTGSMIISAIVGVFASLALAFRTGWYRITSWFRRKPAETVRDEAES
jgi:hypothetical protein